MRREQALKVVLVVARLLFAAMVYPMVLFAKQEPALAMMLNLYVILGILLLLASRDPSSHRSIIAFAAWSSFAHAAVMSFQAFRNFIARGELIGSGVLVIIGVALIVLAPSQGVRRAGNGSRCVGSHSGKTPTCTSPSSKPKAEYTKPVGASLIDNPS